MLFCFPLVFFLEMGRVVFALSVEINEVLLVGCGKGRTCAALILDAINVKFNCDKIAVKFLFACLQCGFKRHIWVSASKELINDSQRDLTDVNPSTVRKPIIVDFSRLQGDIKTWAREGIIFTTYHLLMGESKKEGTRRIDSLIKWMLGDKEGSGCIIFDEAHKAKNLLPVGKRQKSSKTGLCVDELQTLLPKARVLYASATGCSNLRHLSYMSRLGLWGRGTAFSSSSDFVKKVETAQVAGEIIAMELKSSGVFIARTLSFEGCKFDIEDLELSTAHKQIYDKSVRLWQRLIDNFDQAFRSCATQKKKVSICQGQIWSGALRFFKLLMVSFKVDAAVKICQKAIQDDMAVVIAMQATGESRGQEIWEDELDDEVRRAGIPDCDIGKYSGPILTIKNLVKKQFPTTFEGIDADGAFNTEVKEAIALKQEILDDIDTIDLPANPLDQLIHHLGGQGKVAELSGRKFVLKKSSSSETWKYYKRNGSKSEDIKHFQNGMKNVAIITSAASAGISLHADKGCKNKKQRLFISLELPWTAEESVQQFGRVHRSNQEVPPVFRVLKTPLAGENRFVSVVAQRLKSMGALCRGDRRAAMGGMGMEEEGMGATFDQFDVLNDFGVQAVSKVSFFSLLITVFMMSFYRLWKA
jgi:hypothetical protein